MENVIRQFREKETTEIKLLVARSWDQMNYGEEDYGIEN
jgi:hypothetical protein